MPAVEIDHITKSYAGKTAVEDLSFSVDRGEIFGLIGPNGAGKTTLLRLASGILIPDGGRIQLGEAKLDRRSRKHAFRQMGFLTQDPNDQLFCTHVDEDVAYGPTQLGLDPETIRRRVETAMTLMEVTHLSSRPIHTLSYGEMKRVGLAGIIAMQPPLILMDEPTAGLDPASAKHLTSLIRHLNDHHGYTLVMVTHDINMAVQIAKRIVIMDDGRLTADGRPGDILRDEALLKRSRLEPPILTCLFRRIERDGLYTGGPIPVTIEEAAANITEMIAADPVRIDRDDDSGGYPFRVPKDTAANQKR
jgi:cobalt/nickel transport system ATP-binding protein